ncbi:MAG: thiolase family protein [bacterium]
MAKKVAVVGIGMTENKSHWDCSMPALYRLAAKRALADAGITMKKVDAVVFGHSPEYFEGINHPEKWVGEACGAYHKPLFRIHTGGTVGGSTAIGAYYAVASGMFKTVLAISGNKLNETASAQIGLSTVYDPIMGRQFATGAPSAVAVQASRYYSKYGYTDEHGLKVAVKNRNNALNNPYAQLRIPNYTLEMAKRTPVLCAPLRLADMCPTSDAACAMIFSEEKRAQDITETPAWVKSVAAVCGGVNYVDRDWAVPIDLRKAAEIAYERAGITNPRKEIDVVELYDAFSVQELIWSEGLKLCDWGEGGKLIDEGVTYMTGELPVNPSGGVLSANSIGAAAMFRKAEAALQVMGKAGDRQVKDVKISLGHGWGGAIQFHTIIIFSKEK